MNPLISQQLLAQNIRNPAIDLGFTSGAEFLGRLIPALIGLGFVIGAIVFVFILIVGAIQWITSGGDKMRLEQARSRITSALVGVIILLAFFAILNLVECFFGIGLRRVRIGAFDIGFASTLICPQGGGGDGGGDGGSAPSGGNTACPCGGSCSGYYAVTDSVGRRTFAGGCYRCTSGGWVSVGGECGTLTCRDPGWECRNP
ncbi:MAG: hypothetical protein UT24_C0005G0007 [Candidatus Woesebacteria bacterium GW2011_GWB1_39_12]|uniref:Uncharacterized protein n=2 Tax=Candidatus Woeseibacteriota TaxID=1752722 RepID=A0A0G0PIS1_9BACT|nr:MAG: hypothetical protein UT23_C0006G0030 [Candidatus Woesebacteria bacterium GW2011_GWA1_39_12]KKR01298.1 MAG: hypothetical protein UT24_C0005G0007 [Candidatus Woesebacteria bacterium GW2011_GWB1_39_12]